MEQKKEVGIIDFLVSQETIESRKNYKEVVLTDEIYNRWENLNLLDFVEGDVIKKKLALSLERLAHYLVYEYENKSSQMHIDVFPCMVRIIKMTEEEVMPEKIVSIMDNLYDRIKFDEIKEKFDTFFDNTVDFEAELVALISDAYIAELIRDGKYKLVKVE